MSSHFGSSILTLPISVKITKNTTDSPLLRLPVEQRNMIWEFANGRSIVHMYLYSDKYGETPKKFDL